LEFDFGSDESAKPVRCGEIGMAQDVEVAAIVGAAKVDETAFRECLQVERPWFGKSGAQWGAQCLLVMVLSGRVDVSAGTVAKVVEGIVREAEPDLFLPESVEGFDGGLEAGFVRGSKNGRDAEAQAEADDAADGIGKIMWSLESRVVVELCVGGQAEESPVFDEAIENDVGDNALVRPGCGEMAVEGHAGEDVDVGAVGQVQAFDDVEGVEFDAFVCEVGEIPTARRRRATDANSAIEDSASFEDASDGAKGGSDLAGVDQEAVDGDGAAFAEVAGGELGPDLNDAFLDVVSGSASASRRGRLIVEFDAIKT
jgi:hypothetical protein